MDLKCLLLTLLLSKFTDAACPALQHLSCTPDITDCSAPTGTPPKCAATAKLMSKDAAGVFGYIEKLTCVGDKWKIGTPPTDLATTSQIFCQKFCKFDDLKSDCAGDDQCSTPTFIADPKCPTSAEQYYKDASGKWKHEIVKCDKTSLKWVTATNQPIQPQTTNVICSKRECVTKTNLVFTTAGSWEQDPAAKTVKPLNKLTCSNGYSIASATEAITGDVFCGMKGWENDQGVPIAGELSCRQPKCPALATLPCTGIDGCKAPKTGPIPSCTGNAKMNFKLAGKYGALENLVCAAGLWKHGNPATPLPTSSEIFCQDFCPSDYLKSDCTAAEQSKCTTVTFHSTPNCGAPALYYEDSSADSGWREGMVTCNANKWISDQNKKLQTKINVLCSISTCTTSDTMSFGSGTFVQQQKQTLSPTDKLTCANGYTIADASGELNKDAFCGIKGSWVDKQGQPITGELSCRKATCAPLTKMTCTSAIDGCALASNDHTPTCAGTAKLMFKDGTGVVAELEQLNCDGTTWKHGATPVALPASSEVFCLDYCPLNEVKSDCSVANLAECTTVTFLATPSCTTPSEQYYDDGTSWKKATLSCDKTSKKWKVGQDDLVAPLTNVICLKTTCGTKTGIVAVGWEEEPEKSFKPADKLVCSTGYEIGSSTQAYPNDVFCTIKGEWMDDQGVQITGPLACRRQKCATVQQTYTTVTYNQKVVIAGSGQALDCTDDYEIADKNDKVYAAVTCGADGKWTDGTAAIDEELTCRRATCTTDDTLTFDDKRIYLLELKTVSSNEDLQCSTGYELASAVKKIPNGDIKCGKDGKWMENAASIPDPIACRKLQCTGCILPSGLSSSDGVIVNQGSIEVQATSDGCDIIGCRLIATSSQLAVKFQEDSRIRWLTNPNIECFESNKFDAPYKDQGKKRIEAAVCVQRYQCERGMTSQIKKSCTGLPSTANCETVQPFPGDIDDVTCAGTKQLIIKRDGQDVWDTVHKMSCNKELGKWTVKVEIPYPEEFDVEEDATIVCVSDNPNPRPTTTTTTTTTTAPPLICQYCKDRSPKGISCEHCSSKEDVVYTEINADKCGLEVTNGRKLLINNFQESESKLVCERDGIWKTTQGTTVLQFAAQIAEKKKEFQPVSYVILGVGVVFIGVVAISLVVVYFKCRRRVLTPEQALKKERGVTKKYTAINTGFNKKRKSTSNAVSSERLPGTQKSQKGEENNDDAPTLKLA